MSSFTKRFCVKDLEKYMEQLFLFFFFQKREQVPVL